MCLRLHVTYLPPLQAEVCLELQDKNGWGHTQCCGNTYHFGCLFSWLNNYAEVQCPAEQGGTYKTNLPSAPAPDPTPLP